MSFWAKIKAAALRLLTERTLRGLASPGAALRMTAVQTFLGSGFSVEDEHEENRKKLDAICVKVTSDPLLDAEELPSGRLKTKCNLGLTVIAEEIGCTELRGLTADEIVRLAERHPKRWRKDSGERAAAFALKGGFAFGGMTSKQLEDKNGHVAAVAPRVMIESGSLKKDVPWLANVGRPPNGIKLSSACFPVAKGECQYYLWIAKEPS